MTGAEGAMKNSPPWQLVLRGYQKAQDPAQRGRCQIWQAAIGLQGVDSLTPSSYFVSLVEKHILGKIKFPDLEKSLYRYYKWCKWSQEISHETWEADLVSLHIAELLMDRSFHLDPREFKKIHHYLFNDVYDFAGDFRDYDIRKKEWILKGKSVSYADYDTIGPSLNAQFSAEQNFSYDGLSVRESIPHIARFIAGVWLTHPYGEGNTRTTAVFLMRYLQSMGLRMKRDEFAEAWYFRNTLVRACYARPQDGITPDFQYLERFLQNLLLGEQNPLRNQELHVDYPNID